MNSLDRSLIKPIIDHLVKKGFSAYRVAKKRSESRNRQICNLVISFFFTE